MTWSMRIHTDKYVQMDMKMHNVNGTIRIHDMFKGKILTSNLARSYQLTIKIIVLINS